MPKPSAPVIAFDADDTLWPNEPYFRNAEQQLLNFLAPYCSGDDLLERLYTQEIKNLHIFGYGAKGFTLSMIESAIELSGEAISGAEIQKIIDLGKQIMQYEVELLDHVKDTLEHLSEYRLMLITKGDLFDQESKIARSGLADLFEIVEIVSEKDEATYQKLLKKYQIDPENFWMVGNSLKSDVLPVTRIGGTGVHIPYESTWVHEQVETDSELKQTYHELTSIKELPVLVHSILR